MIAVCVKLRWLIIILTLAVTAYLAPYLGDLKFDSSSDGSIPRGDPSQQYFDQVKEDFGNDQVAMLVVLRHTDLGIFEPETLAKIKRLTDSIADFEGVDNIVSLTNSRFLSGLGGEELTNDLIVPAIPPDRDSARVLRENVLSNPLFHKTLVSEDGHAAAINIFLANEPDSVLLATGIDARISDVVATMAGPEELYYAGLIHTRMEINKTMHRDLAKFIPLSFLLILLVLYLSFRNLLGVLLPAAIIIISVVWTFGLVARLGVPINMTMTIIPPLLIAIAGSLTIHITSHYLSNAAHEQHKHRLVVQTFHQLSAPLFICSLTTVVGFASLMISPIPNNQKVGLFSVVGILFGMLLTFTFVPAVLAIVRPPSAAAVQRRSSSFMTALVRRIIRFNLAHRRVVFVVAALVLVISVIGLFRIEVNTDFLSYFKKGSEVRRAADIIGENLAGVSTFYVVPSSDQADIMRDAKVLRGIDSLQRYMESLPGLDKATSMVNIVKLFNQAMNNDDPAQFTVPESQDAVDEAILLTVDQEEPSVRAHYVVEDYSSMAVFARSQLVSTSDLAGTITKVENFAREVLPPEVSVAATGTVVVFAKTIDSIVQGQRNSLLMAVILICLIISLLFRSLKIGIVAMIPNIIPILVIFGIMGWFHLPLNIGTSVVASIALGMADEDTVHYFMQFGREVAAGLDSRQALEKVLGEIGEPVIFTSLTLAIGFAVICLSDFGMLVSVGLLSAITMITCLLSELFLSSALLLTLDFSKFARKAGLKSENGTK